MDRKINWNISGALIHNDIILRAIEFYKKSNIEYSVYDEIPGFTHLSGGREIFENYDELINKKGGFEKIIQEYNSRGIGFNLLLTNHLTKEEELNNEKLKHILNLLNNNNKNGAIVSSDLVNNYIKNNYPNLKTIFSIIPSYLMRIEHKEPQDIYNYYNDLLPKYDMVTVPPEFIVNEGILNLLDKKKTIHLVNSKCIFFCENRVDHYSLIAKYSKKNSICMFNFNCNKKSGMRADALPDNIFLNLIKKGFNNLKLQGRRYPPGQFHDNLRRWLGFINHILNILENDNIESFKK